MQINTGLILVLCSLFFSLPTNAYSTVTFLTVEQGRHAIVDEKFEHYFSRLQPMEMMAKTAGKVRKDNIEKMRKNTRVIYQDAVMAFSSEDKATLSWYTKLYSKLFNKSYPLLANTPFTFVKLDKYIEGGLPHTRGDTIVLHEAMINKLTRAKSLQGEKALYGVGSVLIHELVHVAQRKNVNAFHDLYKGWGFRKIKLHSNSSWMKKHQLINPDGVNLEWIFPIYNNNQRQWILPAVTWSEGTNLKQMPGDFRMRAISVRDNNGKWDVIIGDDHRPVMGSLMTQESLRKTFPSVHGLYHPNEIVAEMIVSLVTFDNYIDKSKIKPNIVNAWEKIFSPVRKVLTK